MPTRCIRALVSGHVQGVFFRDSTRQQARQLGIHGHANNLSDGRVEVLACGETGAVQQLIDWLHIGPQYASVTDVQIESVDTPSPPDFSIGRGH